MEKAGVELSTNFKSKEAKIIAIDTSGAVRQLLTDVLRTSEFKNVQSVATIKECLHILEVEQVDWVITPILTDQDPNPMQLLRLLTENSTLKDVHVSFILTQEEQEILPLAYESGLMSHFSKPFTKDSILAELKEMYEHFETMEWNSTKLAAHYFNKYLEYQSLFDEQVTLFRGMLNMYPGSPDYIYQTVKPLFNLGRKDEAKSSLLQAKMLDANAKEKIEALQEELFPGEKMDQDDGNVINALGINNCVVIDPDDASRKSIVDALKGLGVSDVFEFESGDTAWSHIKKNKEADLIIHEWRIPKVTGPILIQRVRNKFQCVPLVTISSLLKKEDQPLVKEMGVATIIPKPFDHNIFLKSVVHTIQQDKLPTDAETLERKIRQYLNANRSKDALKLKETYTKADIPKNRKVKIEAEFAYYQKNYSLARDLAVSAIKANTDSVMLLNLLGKCFMKLGDFPAALKCLEKAQTMSPMNIQRLCQIAEVNSEMGNDEASKQAIDQAKSVDDESSPIVEVEAKEALKKGDTATASEMMAKLESINNIISYSNNKAIAYTRAGEFNQGIELYRKTIESIPENKKSLLPLVRYNLALGFARGDKLKEALSEIESVMALKSERIELKAKSLQKKIKRAMDRGTPIELSSAESMKIEKDGSTKPAASEQKANDSEEVNTPLVEHIGMLAQVEIAPGEIGVFQLYFHPTPHDPKYTKLMEKLPRFTKREAIAREASGGAEKEIKSAK